MCSLLLELQRRKLNEIYDHHNKKIVYYNMISYIKTRTNKIFSTFLFDPSHRDNDDGGNVH